MQLDQGLADEAALLLLEAEGLLQLFFVDPFGLDHYFAEELVCHINVNRPAPAAARGPGGPGREVSLPGSSA